MSVYDLEGVAQASIAVDNQFETMNDERYHADRRIAKLRATMAERSAERDRVAADERVAAWIADQDACTCADCVRAFVR